MTANDECIISSVNLTINLIKMEEIILQTLIKMRTDYGNNEMIIFAQNSDLQVVADEIKTAIDYVHSSSQLPYKNEKLIENMCLSFRHDYGLLPKLIQEDLRRDCKNWLISYENNKK